MTQGSRESFVDVIQKLFRENPARGHDLLQSIAFKDEVVEEAPIDGKEYVRKDGEWVENV